MRKFPEIHYSLFITSSNPAGVLYYVLANIRPHLRSSLKCIQLIACATTPMVDKYGWEMFLQPFIDEANQLYEVRCSSEVDGFASLLTELYSP